MPDTPLLDQTQLDDAFSKYAGSDIDQRTIQPTPFRNIGMPSAPPEIAGGGNSMSSLDKLKHDIFSQGGDGGLTPGGRSIPLSQLTSQPFQKYDPALEGTDEDMLSLNQGFWDKAANGVIKMGGIALNTAIGSTIGTLNGLGKWAETGEFSSFIDNDFNRQLDDNMKALEAAFPHYRSASEREGSWYEPENLFTANFVFDKVVKNLGFSLGAAVPALLVGKALNALRISSRLFAAGEGLAATEISAAATNLPRVQQLAAMENGFKQAAGGLLKKLGAPGVAGVEQGGSAVRAASAAMSSLGEASMEGYNNMNEWREKAIEAYTEKNGVAPTGEALESINQAGKDIAKASFMLNMAVLSGSEYVQLPKIFSSTFKGEKNIINRTVVDAETGLMRASAPKGLARVARGTAKFGSLFFNRAEALEEGLQFSVTKGTQDYYDKKYRNKDTDFLTSLGVGVKETLTSDEGLENIFLGGLSGALMTSGFISSKGIGQTGKIGERGWIGEGGQRAANTNEFVAGYNNSNFKTYLKEGVDQANRAITIQEQREDAIRQGDILESKDLEFDYSHNYLAHRIKWGRFDLVQDDINQARQDAATDQGFTQLQQEGKASESDTRQTFLQRLGNFEDHAKNVKEQYEALNLKYGGLVGPDGKRVYTPEVLDKMVYSAAKVKDYDKRIKELAKDMMSAGVSPAAVDLAFRTRLAEVEKGSTSEATLATSAKEVLASIESLDENDEVKEDLTTKLADYIEINLTRRKFLKEYNDMKAAPTKFEEATPLSSEQKEANQAQGLNPDGTPKVTKATIKVSTKDGEEELELDTEYYLGKNTQLDKNGKEVYGFPKLTILGENEDGTIKIKDDKGQVRDIPKEALAGFKLGKVSDTVNNKKAKFYMDNINTIFEFNFGKNSKGDKKKYPGRLQYSPKEGILLFVYKDDKGKVRSIEVTGDMFMPKKGYTNALITKIGTLTPAEQKSLEEFTKEKDDRLEAKIANRLSIIGELIDENNAKLEELNRKIFAKKEQLEKVSKDVADLAEFTNKDKYGKTVPINFDKVLQRSLAGLTKLSGLKQNLETEIAELESYKDELDFNGEYFDDLSQNIDQLPTNGNEFLEDIKEQYDAIINNSLMVGEQINTLTKMLDTVKDAIKDLLDFLASAFQKFDSDYPSEIRNSLKDDSEVFESPQALKAYIADYTLIKDTKQEITITEGKVQPIVDKIDSLYKELAQMEKEASAKWAVLDKFEQIAKKHREEQAKKKKLGEDIELLNKFYSTVKTLEGEQYTEDPTMPDVKEDPKKDLSIIASTGTSQKYENANPDSIARREQEFLLNLPNLENPEEIKVLLVTKNTEESLGIKGVIDPAFPDAIRIVYARVKKDGSYTFLDRKGQPSTDVNEMAYGTMHDESLTFNGEDAFREGSSLDPKEVRAKYKQMRESVFSITPEDLANPADYFLSFVPSRGLPNLAKDVNGKTIQQNNNLLDTGLITEGDLFTPLVVVPTRGKTVLGPNGDPINLPMGKPVLDYKGNVVFLNNRNLTPKEAANLADVLVVAVNQFLETGEMTQQVKSYLRGVAFFQAPKEGETVKRNQIYFRDKKIFIGDQGASFDMLSLDPAQLRTVLENSYTYVDNQHLLAFAKAPKSTPFEELSVSKGAIIVSKTWPSYQHYLLAKRDGLAPLTTNIVNTQSGELPIIQKYPIMNITALKNEKSIIPTQQDTKAPKPTTSRKEALATLKQTEGEWSAQVGEDIAEDPDKQVIIDFINEQFPEGATVTQTVTEVSFGKKAEPVSLDAKIMAIVDTKENYERWSNTRDGKDRPQFLDQINMALGMLDKAPDKSKITEEAIRETFKSIKAVQNKAVVDALVPLLLEKYKAAPADNTKGLGSLNNALKGPLKSTAPKKVAPVSDGLGGLNNALKNLKSSKPQVEKAVEKVEEITIDLPPGQDPFGDDVAEADLAATRLTVKEFKVQGDVKVEEAEVRAMLPNVGIKTVQNLIDTLGGGKAWGYALPHFITVWESAPYGVMYHEAFEQVFNFILDKSERKALYNEFKSRKGSFTTYEGTVKEYSKATFMEAKEEMADEFAVFKTTGEIVKPAPKKGNFFRQLLNFLKELFTGAPLSVEKAFYGLAKGDYANSKITTPIKAEPQYSRAVVNTPESLVQDMIIGMTSKLFMDKWTKDSSLIQQLEENEKEATTELFDQLRIGLEDYFEGTSSQSLRAILKKRIQDNPASQAENLKLYQGVLGNWNNVKLQWGNYMSDLKSFLKTFDVAFTVDDNGNMQFNDEVIDVKEERSQAEYNSDSKLFLSAKNSASKAVKLLFATIADSQFIEQENKNKIGQIVRKYVGNHLNIEGNQMAINNLANYAKLFNYTLESASNTNGIERIIAKLREKSSNRNIKINANLEVLLNRIGYDYVAPVDTTTGVKAGDYHKVGWASLDKSQIKMLLKVENALSKQKPSFFVQYSPSKKEHRILGTNIADRTTQLKEEWVENMKGSDYTIASGNQIKFKGGTVVNDKFKFLSNIGISFTEEQFNGLPKEQQTLFTKTVEVMKVDVQDYTKTFLPINAKPEDLPFAGRLNTLASIYSEYVEGNTSESQHLNADGKATSNKILNNYVSYIINDLNNVKTLQEFIDLNPQYNDLYMGDSYLLKTLFDAEGKRNSTKIDVAILEGRRSLAEGMSTSALTLGERLIYEINNNLNGKYYTLLPADSSTQWGLSLDQVMPKSFFKSKEAEMEAYAQKMWSALKNEIKLAQDYESRKSVTNLTVKEDGREIGKSLRFFKGILNKSAINTINKVIDGNGELSEEIYDNFKAQLFDFLGKQADATIATMNDFQLISKTAVGVQIAGVDTNFVASIGSLTEEKLKDLILFREANYVFQNMEMHKLLFNDPAQYKDAEKRVKSFLSGREFSNQSEDLNKVFTTLLNKSGDYQIKPNEFGYKSFTNKIQVQTVAKFTAANTNPDIREALGDKGKAYDSIEGADAQSWAEPNTYREMQWKAGARFTNAQDELHEWLMAYQRNAMLEKGQLDPSEYSKELQAADKKLLRRPIPDTSVNILKPIISGVRLENGVAVQYLYKTSTAPLYYYFVEGTPAEQILLNMQRQGIGLLAMDSAHKVGGQTSKFTSMYNEKGELNQFNTPSEIDYKYFGIQVETGGTKDYQTQGSQLTKLATQNLMNFGVPIDFKGTKAEWDALPDNKRDTPIYRLIKRHNDLLANMAVKRSEKLFDKLGIKETEFGFTFTDKKKVADFILNELTRRELPHNMGEGIEVGLDGEFKSPLEANVNYKKIKEILWSTIESNILRPKISGGSKILLSALGYENYKTETLNGKPVLTSSKLKFYTKGDKTKACQIAIPFYFGTKILEQIEESQGIKFANQKEGFKHVLDYLNNTEEGRDLLEGVGFRIPTQGLNSVDFFEVAEFLPPQMGDTVIFPTEITTKAGSDFDVDKMSTYLKNFYIDVNGYPKVVPTFSTEVERVNFFTDVFIQDVERQVGKNEKSIQSSFNLQNTLAALNLQDNTKQKNKWVPIFRKMFGPDADALDIEQELMERMERAGKSLTKLNDWDTVQNVLLDKFLETKELEAMENEYYRTIKDLMSLPQNFARLITPNDASQLKNLAGEVEKAKGIVKASLTNATRLVDSSFMTLKRHLFLIMKKAVGIAAVGNTNLALNQLSDFTMAIPANLIKTPMGTRNFAIRFDYNESEDGLLHLSGTQNKFGDWLSDLGSQVIDGTVDVAKDEWLANLLGDSSALSVMLYMFKLGIKPETTAFYINQPAIQEYLKLIGIHRNISKISNSVREKATWDIENSVIQKILDLGFTPNNNYTNRFNIEKPSKYTTTSLEAMISKTYAQMSAEEKTLQIQLLTDFIGYQRMASNLFTNVMGYNWDTTAFTSPEVVDNKELAFQKAYKAEALLGSQTQGLLDSSFIGRIKDTVIKGNRALSSLLNTQRGEAKSVLNKTLLKLYIQFFSMEDRINYQQKAEASLIDYLSHNNAKFAGQSLNYWRKALLVNKGGIVDQIKAAQSHPILRFNKLIENIQVVEDIREGYPSYIRLKEQDFDTYTSNMWTDSLKELQMGNIMVKVEGMPKEVSSANILNSILLSQILQYGSSRTKGSFLHLIPNQLYSDLISETLRNISGAEEWYENDYFYKNNWNDYKLVPEAIKEQEDDDTSEYGYSYYVPTYKVEGYPNAKVIVQPGTKKQFPYVKVTTTNPKDKTDKTVEIYKRLDVEENHPISKVIDYKQRVFYIKVNKLGSQTLKEYTPTSILPTNAPVEEYDPQEIIDGMGKYKVLNLTDLVTSDEFTVSLEEGTQEGEATPSKFEEFKNNTKKKDC